MAPTDARFYDTGIAASPQSAAPTAQDAAMVRHRLARLLVLLLLGFASSTAALTARVEEAAPGADAAQTLLLDQEAIQGGQVDQTILLDIGISGQPAGYAHVWLERVTVESGTAVVVPGATDGLALGTVVTGRVTSTVIGLEQTLASGEFFLLPPDGALTLRNAGLQEAVLAIVGLGSRAPRGTIGTDAIGVQLAIALDATTDAMPAGAIHVVLEQWTLAPGTTALAQTTGPLDWFGVMAGDIGSQLDGDQLRNTGELPAVIYHLTITSAVDDSDSDRCDDRMYLIRRPSESDPCQQERRLDE
jgi:hypothetical protein